MAHDAAMLITGHYLVGVLIALLRYCSWQVSCYHQTLACHNTITKNVCYDGPRAGFNFNDGMGGGNLMAQNLIFNMVRETDDHGPVNSWSRIPFDTTRGANAPGLGAIPALTVIEHNFIILHPSTGEGTTGGLFTLCHDDGAAFYADRYNLLVCGGVKNYLGEQKLFEGNVIIEPDSIPNLCPYCWHEQTFDPWDPTAAGGLAFGETFAGNSCIMAGDAGGAALCSSSCASLADMAKLSYSKNALGNATNNTYYGLANSTYFLCGHHAGAPSAAFEAAQRWEAFDKGSSVRERLSVKGIVALARSVLVM
jgi:hypothetical protein